MIYGFNTAPVCKTRKMRARKEDTASRCAIWVCILEAVGTPEGVETLTRDLLTFQATLRVIEWVQPGLIRTEIRSPVLLVHYSQGLLRFRFRIASRPETQSHGSSVPPRESKFTVAPLLSESERREGVSGQQLCSGWSLCGTNLLWLRCSQPQKWHYDICQMGLAAILCCLHTGAVGIQHWDILF